MMKSIHLELYIHSPSKPCYCLTIVIVFRYRQISFLCTVVQFISIPDAEASLHPISQGGVPMSVLTYDSLNLNRLRQDLMDEHTMFCPAASGCMGYVNLIDQRQLETNELVEIAQDGYDLRRYLD